MWVFWKTVFFSVFWSPVSTQTDFQVTENRIFGKQLFWRDSQSMSFWPLLSLCFSLTGSRNSVTLSVQTYDSLFDFDILVLVTVAACLRRISICLGRLITHYRHLLVWHAYVGVYNSFCIATGKEKYS